MARSKNLKKRLKASDKRRKRRATAAETSESSQTSDSQANIKAEKVKQRDHFLGLAIQAIVKHADQCPLGSADQMAVAALRACQKEGQPTGDQSQRLTAELYNLRDSQPIDEADFRHVLKQLLDTASGQQSMVKNKSDRSGDEFIRYLMLVAE